MTTNPSRITGLDLAVSDEVKSRIAVARGVTVRSLAEALDVRRATLSARVNGQAPFAPSLLAEVAAHLGTTATDIVNAAERRLAQAMGQRDERSAS